MTSTRLPTVILVGAVLTAAACSPETTPEQRARVDSLRALPVLERLPGGPAGDLVRRAIEAHGGWEAWGDSDGEHTWIYYFHPESARLAAYRFGTGDEVDRASFTRYGDFRKVAGVLLYGSRTAYSVEGDAGEPHGRVPLSVTAR